MIIDKLSIAMRARRKAVQKPLTMIIRSSTFYVTIIHHIKMVFFDAKKMDESEKFSISFSPTVRRECLITFVQLFNTLRQPTALITIFSHQHFSSTLFFSVGKNSVIGTPQHFKEITIMLKRSELIIFFEGEAFIYADFAFFALFFIVLKLTKIVKTFKIYRLTNFC